MKEITLIVRVIILVCECPIGF